MEIAILLVVGFLGGFVGAQVGSGAMITLPALLFFGISPTLAIGTNMLPSWLTNIIAFFKYLKSGRIVLEKQTASLAVVAFVGSLIGAKLLIGIDKEILSKIVAVFFFALIIIMFRKPNSSSAGEKKEVRQAYVNIAAILSFIIGIYGGFFTVAVTTFFIFVLVYLLKKTMLEAAAESVFIVSIVLSVALLTFIKTGNIDYSLAIPLSVGSIIGSWVGAAVALKLGEKWIKILMAATVLVVILKLLFSL
jgi:hypothetical protein